MSGFVEGIDRSQSTFFPAMLDDYVAEDNLVRAVDAFVEGLELGKLGFGRVAPLEKGRPSYHPATLLKIYIYGYLNRVSSSRRLERECQRNIELVWLTGQLAPDFKTIADFRKDNGKAIREVCRSFVALCRELDLLSVASVDQEKACKGPGRSNFSATSWLSSILSWGWFFKSRRVPRCFGQSDLQKSWAATLFGRRDTDHLLRMALTSLRRAGTPQDPCAASMQDHSVGRRPRRDNPHFFDHQAIGAGDDHPINICRAHDGFHCPAVTDVARHTILGGTSADTRRKEKPLRDDEDGPAARAPHRVQYGLRRTLSTAPSACTRCPRQEITMSCLGRTLASTSGSVASPVMAVNAVLTEDAERISPDSSWPRARAWSTTCRPVLPVAPRTRIRMFVTLLCAEPRHGRGDAGRADIGRLCGRDIVAIRLLTAWCPA